MKKYAIILLLLPGMLVHHLSLAVTKTALATGLWSNTSNWSPTGLPALGDDVIIPSGFTITLSSGTAICTNITVAGTLTVNSPTSVITVNGVTSISGTFNVTNTSTALQSLFTGLLYVGSGGSWSNSITNSRFLLKGGITNNGTFNAGAAIFTFSGNNQTLSGTNQINLPSNVLINGAISVTNLGRVYLPFINGNNANSKWINGVNSYLQYAGSITPMQTGQLIATATGNSFEYANDITAPSPYPSIQDVDYYNLIFSSGGTSTFAQNASANGGLVVHGDLNIINGTSLQQNDPSNPSGYTVTVIGNILGDGNLHVISLGTCELYVGGDYLNTGVLNLDNGNNIIYNGTGTQQMKGGDYNGYVYLSGGPKIVVSDPNTSSASVIEQDFYSNGTTLIFDPTNDAGLVIQGTYYGGGTIDLTGPGYYELTFEGPIAQCPSFITNTINGSAVFYTGSSVQTVCGGNYSYLSLANGQAANPKVLKATSTVTGALNLSNAVLSLNGNNLWIDATSSQNITGAPFSGNNKISFSNTGTNAIYFRGNAASRFSNIVVPVGFTGTDYTAASINTIVGTAAIGSFIGIRPVVTTLSTPYVSRMYNFTSSGFSGLSVFDATFGFLGTDVISGNPTGVKRSVGGVTSFVSGATITLSSAFAVHSPNNVISGSYFMQGAGPAYYRSKNTGNWSNTSIWDVSLDGGLTWGAATNYPGQLVAGDLVSITGSNVVNGNGIAILPINGLTISGTHNHNAGSLTVTGNTLVNATGSLSITGTNTYLQLQGPIVANGVFIQPNPATTIEFQNGFVNNFSNFNFYGNLLFSINNQSISGSGALNLQSSNATIVGAITLTQVMSSLAYGGLNGTNSLSTFEMGPSTSLDYTAIPEPMNIGRINATATGSYFEYSNFSGLIKPTTYYKLSTIVPNATILGNTIVLTDFTGSSNISFPTTATSLFVGGLLYGNMNLDMTRGSVAHVVSITGDFQPYTLVPGFGKIVYCSTTTGQAAYGYTYYDVEFKGGTRKDFTLGAMQVQDKLILSGSVLSVSGSATLNMLPGATIVGTSAFNNTNMVGLSVVTGLTKNLSFISDLVGFYPIGYGNKYTPVNITSAGAGGISAGAYVSLVPRAHTPIGTSYVRSELYMNAYHVALPHSVAFTFSFPGTDIVNTPNNVFYNGASFSGGTVIGTYFSVNASSGSFTFSGATWAAEGGASPLIYRSNATIMNWSSTANWQSSPDGISWGPAGNYPGQFLAGDQVSITGGNTVTMDTDPLPLASMTIAGSLGIDNQNITVNGITSIGGSGQLTDAAFSGKAVFNGTLICNGSFDLSSGNGLAEYHNGIQANGVTFAAARAIFAQNNQTVSGTGSLVNFDLTTIAGAIEATIMFPSVNFNANVTGTNSSSILTIGPYTGARYFGGVTPMLTGILIASIPGTAFTYNLQGNLGIKTTEYYMLSIYDGGAGYVATFTGNLVVDQFTISQNTILSFDGAALSTLSIIGWSTASINSKIDMSGGSLAHRMYLSSYSPFSTPQFTAGLGTVIYNAPNTQIVLSFTYYNLSIAGGGQRNLSGITTVNNDVIIDIGSTLSGSNLAVPSVMQILGNLTVNGVLDFGSVVHNIGLTGNILGNGLLKMKNSLAHTFDIGGDGGFYAGLVDADLPANIIFSSNASVGLLGGPSKAYPNLVVSGTGNKYLLATNDVKGTFYIASGATLSTGSATGTILSVAGNALLNGTLSYSGTNGQTIEVLGNLSVAGANGYIESASGAASSLKMEGPLNTITGGATMFVDNSGFVVEYARNGNQNILNYTHANGALLVSGSGTKSLVVNCSPYNLSITGGNTLDGGNFQISGDAAGNMIMGAGSALLLGIPANPTPVLFPINFTNANIHLDPASTVVYQSNASQLISEVPLYGNLIIDGAGQTKSFNGNTSVTGNLNIAGGTVDFGAASLLDVNGQTIINGLLQTSGASAGNPVMNFHGNVLLNGTINIDSPSKTSAITTGDFNIAFTGGIYFFTNTGTNDVNVLGNFSCPGIIDMSGNSASNNFSLSGPLNYFDDSRFVNNAQSHFSYVNGNQQVAASSQYPYLDVTGGGVKTMQGNVRIFTRINMNGAVLDMSQYSLTVTGQLGGSSFNNTNMIKMSGTSVLGTFMRRGFNEADLSITYPLGTGNSYSGFSILSMSPASGVLDLSVQLLTATGGTNIVNKSYKISTNGIGSVASLDIDFTIDPADIVGAPNIVSIYNPSRTDLPNGYVTLPTDFGNTGTFGHLLDGLWVAQGTQAALYVSTVTTGNWSNPTSWMVSNDGGSSFTGATNYPGQSTAGDLVSISGGNTITITTSIPQILGSVTIGGTSTGMSNAGTVVTFGGKLFCIGRLTMNGDVYFQNGLVFAATVPGYNLNLNQNIYFTTNNQTISGAMISGSFTHNNISILGINLTNAYNGFMYITGGLIGTNVSSIYENRGYTYLSFGGMPMATGIMISSVTSSLISYDGNVPQQIQPIAYGGLQIQNGAIKTLVGDVYVGANFTLDGPVDFGGAPAKTLQVIGLFNPNTTLGMNAPYPHELIFRGIVFTSVGASINAGSGAGRVTYASSSYVVAGSYNNLSFTGGGIKTLTDNITVNNLEMNSGIFDINAYNVTTAGLTQGSPYSASNMIRLAGTATSGALFVTSGDATGLQIGYPIGTGSVFTPLTITSFGPLSLAPSSLGVQIILTTGGTNQVNRLFSISTTGIGSLTFLTAYFGFAPGDVVGSPTKVSLYNPTQTPLPNSNVNIGSNVFNTSGTFPNIPLDGLWMAQTPPLSPPVITGFSPSSGIIGSAVVINGLNFNPAGPNDVYFGAIKITAPANPAGTSISVGVPTGATSVTPILVRNNANGFISSSMETLTTSGARQFTVTNTPVLTPSYTRTDIGSGLQMFDIQTGDFNSDGNTDLAIANGALSSVGIYLGAGNGTFNVPSTLPSDQTRALAIADFNGDGKQDLAIAAEPPTNGVAVRLGNGAGGFGSALNFPVLSTLPRGIKTGDFNKDGKIDIITANQAGNDISLLLGDGLGSFGTAATFSIGGAGNGPINIEIGDFNNDGKPDVVTSNYLSSNLSVLLGNGLGSFGTPNILSCGGTVPYAIAIGDFDEDGNLDIASGNNGSSNIGILLGNGSGNFGSVNTYPLGGDPYPNGLKVADFNGDGIMDLGAGNYSTNAASIVLGTGTGSFGVPYTVSVTGSPTAFTVGDFNGDGKTDFVTGNGSLSVMLEYGSTFTGLYVSTTSGNWTSPSIWSVSTNSGVSFVGAVYYPGQTVNGDVVSITGGTSVTLVASLPYSIASLTVGGTMNVTVADLTTTGNTLLLGSGLQLQSGARYISEGAFGINNSAILNANAGSKIEFQNGIDFNSTGNSNIIGEILFSINNQTIGGLSNTYSYMGNTTVLGPINVTYTKSNIAWYGSLTGSNINSVFETGSFSSLDYNSVVEPMSTGILISTATGNAIWYVGPTQNIKANGQVYNTIHFSGSGSKNIAGDLLAQSAQHYDCIVQIDNTVPSNITLSGYVAYNYSNEIRLGGGSAVNNLSFGSIYQSNTCTLTGGNNSLVIYDGLYSNTSVLQGNYNAMKMDNISTGVLVGPATINNLTLTGSSTFNTGAYQVTGNVSGNMQMDAGTSMVLGDPLSLAGINFPGGYASSNIKLDPSSTIVYASSGFQTVSNIPVYGNLVLTTSGIKSNLIGILTVTGSMNIGTGVTYNTTNDLYLSGDFTDDGTFTQTPLNRVTLRGATLQSLSGTSTTQFMVLSLNKTGGDVMLNQDIQIKNELNFNGPGNLVMSNAIITFQNTSSITGVTSPTSMIRMNGSNGKVVREGLTIADFDFLYPVGTGTVYSPVSITGLNALVTPTAQLGVRLINTTGGLDMVNRIYELSSSNITGISSVHVDFAYDPLSTEANGTPNTIFRYNPIQNTVESPYINLLTGHFGVNGTYTNVLDGEWLLQSSTTLTGLLLPVGNLCAGWSYPVTVMGTGLFNGGNIFGLELSASDGSFPGTSILSWPGILPNTVLGITLPAGLSSSANYKIRAFASNPSLYGRDITPLTITGIPVISSVSPTSAFPGDGLTLTGSNMSGVLGTILANGQTVTGFITTTGINAIQTINSAYTVPSAIGSIKVYNGCGTSPLSLQVLTVWPAHATGLVITIPGGPYITVSGGNLVAGSVVNPNTASPLISWSIIPANGVASIDGTGVLQALNDGVVTIIGTSVSDPTVTGIYVITIVGQAPQVISASTTLPVHLCQGQALVVPFTKTGSYLPGSFIAELYNGTTTVGIGSAAGNPGSINTTIPGGLFGTDFRIRVRHTLATGATLQDNGQDITVAGIPVLTAMPVQNICSGATTNITFTGTQNPYTFTWNLISATVGITGVYSGIGTELQQTIEGSGTLLYSVTGSNGCVSSPINLTINVHDIPTVDNPGIQAICSGNLFTLTVTSPISGVIFTWTPTVTGSVTGSSMITGNTISQTLTGQGYVNYMIIPVANGCTGPGYNLEVGVSGTPDLSLGVTLPNGNFICSTEDMSLIIQNSQIGILYNAYIGNTSIADLTDGTGGNILVTIPASSFSAGPNTIRIKAASVGCGTGFLSNTVSGLQAASPDTSFLISVSNPNVCQGEDRTISLGGSQNGVLYAPFMGLVQVGPTVAGTGSAMDVGVTGSALPSGIDVIKVQALSPGCTGYLPFSHSTTLTVQALPTVNPVFNTRNCSGLANTIVLTSTPAGASFTWSLVGTNTTGNVTGQTSGGTGNIDQTLSGLGTVDYLVFPKIGVCAGTPKLITIRVNGQPNTSYPVKADSVCGGALATVNVGNSELGVDYRLLSGSTLVSSIAGTGGPVSLTIPGTVTLNLGSNVFSLLGVGCVSQAFSPDPNLVVLSSPVSPAVTSTLGTTATCDKQNITLSVPNTYSKYQWRMNGIKIAGEDSNAYVPVIHGTYSVEVYTGNNCFILSEIAPLEFTINQIKPVITASGGNKDTLLVSSSATGYQWYVGQRAIVGADKQTYRPYFSAAYRVRINPKGKCSEYSDDYYLNNVDYDPLVRYDFEMTDSTIVIDIDKLQLMNQLEISPNPASERFSIRYKAHKRNSVLQLTVYNSLGSLVSSQSIQTNDVGMLITEMERENLPSGIYKVVVSDGDERVSANLVFR